MPGDCTPIPKEYPPNATLSQQQCIDAAYSQYRAALAACNGDQACCKSALSAYTEAVQRCMAPKG